MSAPLQDPTLVSVRELVMMVLKDSTDPNLIQLGAAIPNTELVIPVKLNRIMAGLTRQVENRYYMYDIPPGNEALRIQIAQRGWDRLQYHSRRRGHYLRLLGSLHPQPQGGVQTGRYCGDRIADVFRRASGARAHWVSRALEIPTHPRDGISLSALRFALEHNSIQACLVLSNFNNPLGSCIPDENKQQLVELITAPRNPADRRRRVRRAVFLRRAPQRMQSLRPQGSGVALFVVLQGPGTGLPGGMGGARKVQGHHRMAEVHNQCGNSHPAPGSDRQIP